MPLRNKRLRRPLAIVLVIVGGLLLWLAPDEAAGITLLVTGVVLEIAGIAVERQVKEH